jgi:hypothetical protein
MEEGTPVSPVRAIANARRNQNIALEACLWIALWLITSPLIIACIKTLTTTSSLNFPYPWLLIGFTNGGTWILCYIMQWFPKYFPETSMESNIPWKFGALLGSIQGVEVGIAAIIIQKLSITLRTEIHMLSPAFIFVLAVVFGLESLDARICFSVFFVTIGGSIASYGNMTSEGLELVPFAFVSAILSTLRWVLTQKWISPGGQSKPSPISVTLRIAPFTAFVGFVVAVVQEPQGYEGLFFLPHPGEVAGLLILISTCVCVLVVSELRVVQLTSALLFGFLVPLHNASIILLDASLKGTKVSRLSWSGILLCAIATCFYLTARRRAKEDLSSVAREPAPYQTVPPPSVTSESSHDRMC